MKLILAFVVGGAVCALFELIAQLTHAKPPVLLTLGVIGGGVLGATGVINACLAAGDAGFGIMVVGFGNGVYQAAVQLFNGSPLAMVLAIVEVAVMVAVGVLGSTVYRRVHREKSRRLDHDSRLSRAARFCHKSRCHRSVRNTDRVC